MNKQQLAAKIWESANQMRSKIEANEYKDYILGFIFYKYLSEKMHTYADKILKPDGLLYKDIAASPKCAEYMEAIKDASLEALGYFLEPSELFSEMARRGNADGQHKFILDDLKHGTKLLIQTYCLPMETLL